MDNTDILKLLKQEYFQILMGIAPLITALLGIILWLEKHRKKIWPIVGLGFVFLTFAALLFLGIESDKKKFTEDTKKIALEGRNKELEKKIMELVDALKILQDQNKNYSAINKIRLSQILEVNHKLEVATKDLAMQNENNKNVVSDLKNTITLLKEEIYRTTQEKNKEIQNLKEKVVILEKEIEEYEKFIFYYCPVNFSKRFFVNEKGLYAVFQNENAPLYNVNIDIEIPRKIKSAKILDKERVEKLQNPIMNINSGMALSQVKIRCLSLLPNEVYVVFIDLEDPLNLLGQNIIGSLYYRNSSILTEAPPIVFCGQTYLE